MATITTDYWCFYMDGRNEKRLKTDIDIERLSMQIYEQGSSVRDDVFASASLVVAPLESGKTRTKWIDKNRSEIALVGGDESAAYSAWLAGRRDELADRLERDVLGVLDEVVYGVKDDERDDDDDDDGEDEDGDEEDED